MKPLLQLLFIYCAFSVALYSQRTVGLLDYQQDKSFNGLSLFCPTSSTTTYLIDNCGRVVHTWQSTYLTGHSVYLLPDGSIIRAGNSKNTVFTGGGSGGIIERIGWDGSMIWSYTLSNDSLCQHHDFRVMPNGNVLMIAWHRKSAEQAKAAGRDSVKGDLWSEKIVEVKPTGPTSGEIVWEWSLWDHLVQEKDPTKANYGKLVEHPERMNINFSALPTADWVHFNAMDYNADLDQVMISAHANHEIWIIDHSTTTAEAASHSGGRARKGGDLLFRWGNPATYNGGTPADEKTKGGQHNAQWIPKGLPDAGNIMFFNNRAGGIGSEIYSSVDIIAPTVDEQGNYARKGAAFAPDSAYWRFIATPPPALFGTNLSGAQRLPNGNTLICSGPRGTFMEITPAKEVVWRYISPISQGKAVKQGDSISNNSVFRCLRYGYDYPAFAGKTLVSGNPIEVSTIASDCLLPTTLAEEHAITTTKLLVMPNPAKGICQASFVLDAPQYISLEVFDILGRKISTLAQGTVSAGEHRYSMESVPNATLVFVRLTRASGIETVPLRVEAE